MAEALRDSNTLTTAPIAMPLLEPAAEEAEAADGSMLKLDMVETNSSGYQERQERQELKQFKPFICGV